MGTGDDEKREREYAERQADRGRPPIEVEAIAIRLQRDGVAVTYIMPPVAPAAEAGRATLPQLLQYCEAQREIAEHKLRAAPDSHAYAHDLAVFAGLVKIIQSCFASDVIKAELRRLAIAREAARTRAATAAETAPTSDDDAERGA